MKNKGERTMLSKEKREQIENIVNETREVAEKQYKENKKNQDKERKNIKQAKKNLVQLEKEDETIRYYRNKIEVLYNYMTEED